MSRVLDASLLAAMNSGVFTPWFELQLISSDLVTVVFSTTDVLGFEMDGLTCKVTFHDPDYYDEFSSFRLLRGITVNGVPNYVTSSRYFPFFDRHTKRLRTLEGHVFPMGYYTTPGDVTYHQIIDTICNAMGLTVIFADPAAAWLDYQFYPTGRTLVLNDAKQFFTVLRQKYLIFATDYDADRLLFYQATASPPTFPTGYISVSPGKVTLPGNGAYKQKTFISRDENMTVHTSGGTNKPIHNLGFLPSTASHPARYSFVDTNDWIIQDIPPNLKYLDFDALHMTFDISDWYMWPCKFREVFDKKLSPSWQWQARYLDIFATTEGGALPSTLEAAAPYTPLNVSNFNKNLNTTHNNLQAMADKVDEMDCGPAIYADTAKAVPDDDDLFPLVDSDTATHLVRKFSWANFKIAIASVIADNLRDLFLNNSYVTVFKDWRDNAGFTASHTNTGAFTNGLLTALATTGATTNSRCCLYQSSYIALVDYFYFYTRFKFKISTQSDMTHLTCWVGFLTNPTAPTATENHAAFKIVNGSVYASCGNGTNGHLIDTGVDIAIYEGHDFYIKFLGSSILYYVDGVLKVTLTTYLPNYSYLVTTLYLLNTAAETKTIAFFPFWIMQGND